MHILIVEVAIEQDASVFNVHTSREERKLVLKAAMQGKAESKDCCVTKRFVGLKGSILQYCWWFDMSSKVSWAAITQ